MWLWHSAEEAEHKCTAFDLYQALGGNNEWRITWMKRVTIGFWSDVMRQTVANLKHDVTCWRLRTCRSAASFFVGKHGILRFSYRQWRDYLRADFHPSQHDSQRSDTWLKANAQQYSVVGS